MPNVILSLGRSGATENEGKYDSNSESIKVLKVAYFSNAVASN